MKKYLRPNHICSVKNENKSLLIFLKVCFHNWWINSKQKNGTCVLERQILNRIMINLLVSMWKATKTRAVSGNFHRNFKQIWTIFYCLYFCIWKFPLPLCFSLLLLLFFSPLCWNRPIWDANHLNYSNANRALVWNGLPSQQLHVQS